MDSRKCSVAVTLSAHQSWSQRSSCTISPV